MLLVLPVCQSNNKYYSKNRAVVRVTFLAINKNAPHGVSVETNENATAFDAIIAAGRKNECYKIKYQMFGALGAYITEVCGIKIDNSKSFYWFFYVNGKRAPVGVSSYIMQNNDYITLSYEYWNSTSAH